MADESPMATILLLRPPEAGAPGEETTPSPGSGLGFPRRGEAVVEITEAHRPHRVMIKLVATRPEGWRLESVEVQRSSDDDPFDAATFQRLPLSRYLQQAVARVLDAEREQRSDTRARSQYRSVLGGSVQHRRPPRIVDDETLRRVARLYRAALASTEPRERMAPTAAVAKGFGVNRTDAGRLVAHARRHGVLHPAIRRRAGESPPGLPSDRT